jgi:excinuclease ABC subunit A
LDEPTTGLHFADVEKLLHVLHRLVATGNTVIVIEHNLDVIKTADWIIDLGPEGGARGGRIVAEGTPEAVAQAADSATGEYLARVLRGEPIVPLSGATFRGGANRAPSAEGGAQAAAEGGAQTADAAVAAQWPVPRRSRAGVRAASPRSA